MSQLLVTRNDVGHPLERGRPQDVEALLGDMPVKIANGDPMYTKGQVRLVASLVLHPLFESWWPLDGAATCTINTMRSWSSLGHHEVSWQYSPLYS